MKLIIAGTGLGADDLITDRTRRIFSDADLVITSLSRVDFLKKYNSNFKVMKVIETIDFINSHAEDDMTCVLAASGDTGFYSIAKTVRKRVSKDIEISYEPAIGSMAYFFAAIGESWDDARLISLHGNENSIIPYICYNEKVFALTGGKVKAADVIREAVDAGFGDEIEISVGENLGVAQERIVSGSPAELVGMEFSDLTVMIIKNKKVVSPYRTLKDSDFIRADVPMTKESVRNLSVAALEIGPDDTVYDVGAGTGSVTCAMALKANNSMVFAVEKKEAAYNLIKENMEHLGIRNINLTKADAPDGMENFPPPDKVFIGGSTGSMRDIVRFCLEKNSSCRFVINAVTIETLSEAVEILKEEVGEPEIVSAGIARNRKLGRYNLMTAENPVYIISAGDRA